MELSIYGCKILISGVVPEGEIIVCNTMAAMPDSTYKFYAFVNSENECIALIRNPGILIDKINHLRP